MPLGNVVADIAGAALILLRVAGLFVLYGRYQVVGEPGGGLVEPFKLILLLPGIGIVQTFTQLLDVTLQPVFNGQDREEILARLVELLAARSSGSA